MNKTRFNILIVLLAIAGLLLVVAWMAGMFSEKMAPGTTKPPVVDSSAAITVISQPRKLYEPVPASIQAKQATMISSRILSRIEKIHVRAGDLVDKGQLLIELEQTDLQSRLSQANAAVNSVNARLVEAKQSLARAVELSKTGVIAKADLDRAKANHDALLADLTNAKQASHEAKVALGFAKIFAPMNGRIVDRFAEPGDTTQPGVQLLSLYNPLSLRVEAHVREQLAMSLSLQQQLTVVIPATNRQLVSTIEELVPAGNPGSRSFLVKCSLHYSEGLLPGMYARLHIPAGTQSALLVPSRTVARVGQLDVVWTVDQGVVTRRFIRTGKTADNDMVEVISGLKAGEQLLPVPLHIPKAGVEPITPPSS